MKKVFSILMTVLILSATYVGIMSVTNEPMLAASVTVGISVFSAIMHLSQTANFALNAILIPDFTEKSSEDIDKMNRDELGEYLKGQKEHDFAVLRKKCNEDIEAAVKANSDAGAIEALQSKMSALVDEQNEALLRIKAAGEVKVSDVEKSLTEVLESKKDEIGKMVEKGAGKVVLEVALKAGASQNPADIGSREQLGQWLSGIGQVPHKRLYMKDRIRVVPTSKEYVKYMDQDTVVRDAKNVAQCAVMTTTTKVTWIQADLQTKKVKDYVNVCIDMLDDYDFVSGEINNLINSSVALKTDNGLLLDNGAGALLNGVAGYASTFNASAVGANYALSVQAPTLIDLLVVAKAQIMAFGSEGFFMADTAYINPKDYTLMKLLKDGDDNYIKSGSVDPRIFQDQTGNLWIDGTLLVLPNPSVVENEAYVFDSTKATIYQRRNAVIEMSFENRENFENDVVTVKAYERLNMLVRTVDTNAFMHIPSISLGITAITKV